MMRTPSFRLEGKRALVVGASSGIGQACAVALGEYGADVTAVARRCDALAGTVAMIEGLNGCASSSSLDITNIAAAEDWIAQNGPFDILINSAGSARHSKAIDTKIEDFEAVTDINFKSAYFVTRAVAKGLIEAEKPGSLINITSQMAKIGGIDRAVYAGTKHAVEGMTKSMAIEWGMYGVRVNTICPTFIRTALTASTFEEPEKMKWIANKIKLGRIGKVEDIMGAAIFLASDASALITGTAILVDGGWTSG